jgi:hypothetical protein
MKFFRHMLSLLFVFSMLSACATNGTANTQPPTGLGMSGGAPSNTMMPQIYRSPPPGFTGAVMRAR